MISPARSGRAKAEKGHSSNKHQHHLPPFGIKCVDMKKRQALTQNKAKQKNQKTLIEKA